MTRQFLKKGYKLCLHGKDDGRQKTYMIKGKLKHGEYGSSCLCYIALEEESDRLVVLKEFYPECMTHMNFDPIVRDENGKLNLPIEIEVLSEAEDDSQNMNGLQKCFYDFCRNVTIAKQLILKKELSEEICFFDDVQLLYGNGTCYYENRLIDKSVSWLDFVKQSSTGIDEIITIALNIICFLKKIHKNGFSIIDLKPEDILIKFDEIRGEFLLNKLYFFDLDAVMKLGEVYDKEKLRMTPIYSSQLLSEINAAQIEITDKLDFAILANILSILVKGKEQQLSKQSKVELFDYLRSVMSCKLEEQNIYERLSEILKRIKMEQYNELMRKVLPLKEKKYTIIRVVILSLNVLAYGILGYILILYQRLKLIIDYGSMLSILLFSFFFILFTVGIKILNSLLCERIARIKISCYYFDRETSRGNVVIRTGEFNTFRQGGRRYSTYQDESKNNMRRQHLRRVLWILFAVAIIFGLVLSIELTAAPIFFAFGLSSAIIFLYSDLIPSTRFYYHSCQIIPDEMKRKVTNYGMERACYHRYEYLNTKENPFDLDQIYYIVNNRNLFKIRNNLLNNYYVFREETFSIVNRIRLFLDYDYRNDYYRKCEADVKLKSLKFEPLHIRHIYKQSFDRMRNQQLTVGISLVILLAFCVFLNTMRGFESVVRYFMIPKNVYYPLTITFMFVVFCISLCQIIYSSERERRIADVSYKSRYASDQSLNELLIQDIVQGIVKPVDLIRGINQTEGYIYTYRNDTLGIGEYNRVVRTMHSRQMDYNRRMLHHDIFANRIRSAITIWISFGIAFSVLVWLKRWYVCALPLFTLTVIIHVILRNVIIPGFGKKRLINNIKKFYEENEK